VKKELIISRVMPNPMVFTMSVVTYFSTCSGVRGGGTIGGCAYRYTP
jgi:hypothetical protein